METNEQKIWEYCGFYEIVNHKGRWLPNSFSEDSGFIDWEFVSAQSEIYELDWQAKYLWPKLVDLDLHTLEDGTEKGYVARVDYEFIEKDKDPATAILKAVMEMINERMWTRNISW